MLKNTIRVTSLLFVATAVSAPLAAQGQSSRPKSRPKIAVAAVKTQVAAAVLAAPGERRAGATVMAYRADGTLFKAKSGDGDLICLADDPTKSGFQAACYHRDLEPYMARGRALRAAGISGEENRTTRWKEIEQGTLAMPKQPRALYVLHGQAFDPAKGQVSKAYLRWVIYTPYATPESTGLSLAPAPGAPWLMFPGTPGAHIMINPPRP